MSSLTTSQLISIQGMLHDLEVADDVYYGMTLNILPKLLVSLQNDGGKTSEIILRNFNIEYKTFLSKGVELLAGILNYKSDVSVTSQSVHTELKNMITYWDDHVSDISRSYIEELYYLKRSGSYDTDILDVYIDYGLSYLQTSVGGNTHSHFNFNVDTSLSLRDSLDERIRSFKNLK